MNVDITGAGPPGEGRALALFLPSFDRGGVEKMMVHMALGLSGRGIHLDFVVRRRVPGYLDQLPPAVRVVELGPTAGVEAAAAYLRQASPARLLSSKDENNALAARARQLAGVDTRVWFRVAGAESSRLAEQPFWKRWKTRWKLRRLYRQADGIIAVSTDLGRDVARVTGIDAALIRTAHNPVVTPCMLDLAAQPAPHPWLECAGPPLVLGVGRLARVKNFALLIKAFARLRRERPCRLMILGEGRERAALERLAARLGVSGDVALPGHVANPYAYMARCRLFVLSSLSEGSPNALTEALALGVPVVATDCLSGPRELLQDGRFGPLVPIEDAPALAEAMLRTLDNPLPADFLRQAALPFTIEGSAREYAEILGLLPGERGSAS